MSAWDDFLERLPLRMRSRMENTDNDAGIAMRAICVELDVLRDAIEKTTAPRVCDHEPPNICAVCIRWDDNE